MRELAARGHVAMGKLTQSLAYGARTLLVDGSFDDCLRLVREAAGPNVFLLGCNIPQNMRSFGGAFGLVDAMRVGPDTGSSRIGAPHASRPGSRPRKRA